MMDGFWTLCRAEGLLPAPGGKLLAAVSGGADSMCLLHLLCAAGAQMGFAVEAAHFDHQIRPASGEDAAFVRRWCEARAIPFHLGCADIPALSQGDGTGLEDAARRYRYAFLQQTARAIGADCIATAHNAEDNAETLLLHLLRGSGLNGLGGIAPRQGAVVRPLLTTHRREIEAYNQTNHVPHVEDATNADSAYTRNFLRHQVLPLLEQRNPSVVDALNRTARALREDEDFMALQAAQLLRATQPEAGGVALPAALLREVHPALGKRALQLLVAQVDSAVVLTSAQRAQGLALCGADNSSGWVSLPHGLSLGRVYDKLVVYPRAEALRPVPLQCPGITEASGWRFTVTEAVCPGGKYNQPDCFYLKAGAYTLRPRAAGDRITLPARPRKTVKALLMERRVPRHLRDQLPIFASGEQVAAVAGFGADTAFLPRVGDRCLRVEAARRDEGIPR